VRLASQGSTAQRRLDQLLDRAARLSHSRQLSVRTVAGLIRGLASPLRPQGTRSILIAA
jgi:hypothetical protein